MNRKALAAAAGLVFSTIPGMPSHAGPQVISQPGPIEEYSGVTPLPCATGTASILQPGPKVNLIVTNESSSGIFLRYRTTSGEIKISKMSLIRSGESGSATPDRGRIYEIHTVNDRCLASFMINSKAEIATVVYR
ncbi:hypothetical protein QLQ12_11440 [Actinoplanes sp. NEAU-A12]|uniref:Secreted protein n=1 Tax=Actinoplanes sandaracinus TaxID=3045177 RepID=A0ABT6WHL7_9ACTN|nr:hypothetical protein [Actinoplanes sandaracinus]MDI6099211.1 hypothetical protein [Actinoplanes sandaracinus]